MEEKKRHQERPIALLIALLAIIVLWTLQEQGAIDLITALRPDSFF